MFGKTGTKEKDKKTQASTFTKKWVNRCMWFAWIGIFWCFLLATFGKVQVAENLATALVINIIGVMLGYLAKSFFETREEKRNEITTMSMNFNNGELDQPRDLNPSDINIFNSSTGDSIIFSRDEDHEGGNYYEE